MFPARRHHGDPTTSCHRPYLHPCPGAGLHVTVKPGMGAPAAAITCVAPGAPCRRAGTVAAMPSLQVGSLKPPQLAESTTWSSLCFVGRWAARRGQQRASCGQAACLGCQVQRQLSSPAVSPDPVPCLPCLVSKSHASWHSSQHTGLFIKPF